MKTPEQQIEKFPVCEACGDPGRIRFDSQGEGYFWLCGKNDEAHLDDIYCGIISMPAPTQPARTDTERLDWMIKNSAKVINVNNKYFSIVTGTENYQTISISPYAAIDAAMDQENENG